MEPLSGGSRYPSDKVGGRSSIPRDNGGAGLQKKIFSALRASFRSENKREEGEPPGLSPLPTAPSQSF